MHVHVVLRLMLQSLWHMHPGGGCPEVWSRSQVPRWTATLLGDIQARSPIAVWSELNPSFGMWMVDKELDSGVTSHLRQAIVREIHNRGCGCRHFEEVEPALRNGLSHVVLRHPEQWGFFLGASMVKLAAANAKNRLLPDRQFVDSHAQALAFSLGEATIPVYQPGSRTFVRTQVWDAAF